MAQDWYCLPADIVGCIALKLETIEDFIRFSSVCRLWNRSSSLVKPQWRPPSPVPWLLLSEDTNNGNKNCVRKVFNIRNNKFYQLNLPQTLGKKCWGSTYGWIAMLGRDLKVELFNPITQDRISFPSLEAIYEDLKAILQSIETIELREEPFYWFMDCFLQKLIVLKVSRGVGHEFVVMVIYQCNTRLAFARHGDQKWTSVNMELGDEGKVVDVVVMGNNALALCDNGSIRQWNVKEFYSRKIVASIEYCPLGVPDNFNEFHSSEQATYLVQSGCDLLMVLRYKKFAKISDGSILDDDQHHDDDDDDDDDWYCKTVYVRVFKLDHKHKIWEETKDFGNVALFIGDNYSMCVPVAWAKNLERNCIYFTDDLPEYWTRDDSKICGLDTGIYDNKHGEIRKFYDNDDLPYPLYPAIWFISQF